MFEISAYHEAGHAFMAIFVGARVRYVTIEPDRDDGPERHADIQVEWPLDQFTTRELHKKSVLVALAGPVAEMIHSGEPYHPGFVAEWAADWRAAWEAAAQLVPAERKRLSYLEQATAQLYRLLNRDDHWAGLAAIVDNLLAHETLEGGEVEDIMRQWLRSLRHTRCHCRESRLVLPTPSHHPSPLSRSFAVDQLWKQQWPNQERQSPSASRKEPSPHQG
jgi:hypothetical protein